MVPVGKIALAAENNNRKENQNIIRNKKMGHLRQNITELQPIK